MEYKGYIFVLLILIIILNFEDIKNFFLLSDEDRRRTKILKEAKRIWDDIQPKINDINLIYEKLYCEKYSKVGFLDKVKDTISKLKDDYITKETKKSFEEDKSSYNKFKSFYIKNNLVFPNEVDDIDDKIDKIHRALYVEEYIKKDLNDSLSKLNFEQGNLVNVCEELHEIKKIPLV